MAAKFCFAGHPTYLPSQSTRFLPSCDLLLEKCTSHGSHGGGLFWASRSNQAVWQQRHDVDLNDTKFLALNISSSRLDWLYLCFETPSSKDVTLQEGPVALLLLGAPHIEDFDFLVASANSRLGPSIPPSKLACMELETLVSGAALTCPTWSRWLLQHQQRPSCFDQRRWAQWLHLRPFPTYTASMSWLTARSWQCIHGGKSTWAEVVLWLQRKSEVWRNQADQGWHRANQWITLSHFVDTKELRAKTPLAPGPSDFIIHWQTGSGASDKRQVGKALK